jgi:hypothetical protein
MERFTRVCLISIPHAEVRSVNGLGNSEMYHEASFMSLAHKFLHCAR